METKVRSKHKEVIIGKGRPTVLIGERINPTGKTKLAEALQVGNFDLVRKEALAQVQAGADILDVNAGISGTDEKALLVDAVQIVMETVDTPLCIDSNNSSAIEAALKVYKGKPIINSVNGDEQALKEILPLVKEYNASVIVIPSDDKGIPYDTDQRLRVAYKIVEQAEILGIPRSDVIVDCLAMALGTDTGAGLVTLETIRKLRIELGVNMTIGASNVSFGMPERNLINSAFLPIAIAEGVNCPIVDVAKIRPLVLAVDLALGRDDYAMRFLKAYRDRRRDESN